MYGLKPVPFEGSNAIALAGRLLSLQCKGIRRKLRAEGTLRSCSALNLSHIQARVFLVVDCESPERFATIRKNRTANY
jgi:hypothetical protein